MGLAAKEHVLERMGLGKSLSKAVLKRISADMGEVYAFLPEDISDKSLYTFAYGFVTGNRAGLDDLVAKLDSYLSVDKNSVVVIENASFWKGAKFIQGLKSCLAFLGEEVYHFVSSQHKGMTRGSINEACGWLDILIVTSLPSNRNLKDREDMDEETISVLAEGVEVIVVGAYDGDAYLIWELQEGGVPCWH